MLNPRTIDIGLNRGLHNKLVGLGGSILIKVTNVQSALRWVLRFCLGGVLEGDRLTSETCPQVIVPGEAIMRDGEENGVDTLYWMRESELKHGRIAQLAGEEGLWMRGLSCTILSFGEPTRKG